jgi:zinc protease
MRGGWWLVALSAALLSTEPARAQGRDPSGTSQAERASAPRPVAPGKGDPDAAGTRPLGQGRGVSEAKHGEYRTGSGELRTTAQAAATPPKAGTKPGELSPPLEAVALDLRQAKLENGLRVVMNPDHSSPTVAVSVTYDVGSRNETPGRSGFAHLFEHMMFQGSRNVPKGEFFKLVSEHGGVLNGTTSSDRTNYFEVLPSNQLKLALWLEADRMKGLDVTPENFENQRRVVQEEYRMRVSNAAYVRAQMRLDEVVFRGYWPYQHPTIGSMQDLEQAEFAWVKAFHANYYVPNRAVLAIAGDFEPDAAMDLVLRYFADARAQPAPAYEPPPAADQTAPRREVIEDPHAQLPAFYYGWMGPPARAPDHYALELAIAVLTDGESSRLYQKLVRDRAWAQDVTGWVSGHRGPDLIALEVQFHSLDRLDELQRLVEGELLALGRLGPSRAEMLKAQARIQAGFVFGLQSNLQRATQVGQFELFWGDARLLNSELERYLAVTPGDVARVVKRYLVPERRTSIENHPLAKPKNGTASAGQAQGAPGKDGGRPGATKHEGAGSPVAKPEGAGRPGAANAKGPRAPEAKPQEAGRPGATKPEGPGRPGAAKAEGR